MLLLSLAALFVGPAIYQFFARGGQLARTIDLVLVGILAVTLGGFLLPHLWADLGPWSIALVGAGYLLPGLLERVVRRAAETMHVFSILVALAGLGAHAMLDGAGLAGGGHDHGLGLAIVMHRFGVGLLVWLIVVPAFDARAGWMTLALMAAATVAGYFLSDPLRQLTGEAAWPVIAALIGGMILHSLVHRGHVANAH